MTQPPFADARLKIERAEKHIREFQRMERAFRKSVPYLVVIELNPDPLKGPLEHYLWRLKVRGSPHPRMSVVLGDVFHNLRSALDNLTCEGLRRVGINDFEHVYFPIGKSKQGFEACLKNGLIQPLGPTILGRIAQMEAYPGGKLFLSELHQLNISDKHRLMVPTVAGGGIPVLKRQNDGLKFADFDFVRPMEDGAIWDKSPDFGLPELQIGAHFEPTFQIQFGDGVPFKGEPILPTLRQLVDATSGVISVLEA